MKSMSDIANGWFDIDWPQCYQNVAVMQNALAVAYMAKEFGKVKQLQHNLVSSFAARAIAVRNVATINKGKSTPGIDKIANLDPAERFQLIKDLAFHHKATPKPVRRVWLSKDGNPIKRDYSNGRPLGIPCLYDRAAQALWALALYPIAECWGDRHSYGFRPHRSTQDAMVALYLKLSTRHRPVWVLEADIKGFFDNISHQWILEHIPMDKKILKAWLKAGYIDRFESFETEAGVPQGGVISPMIANMVLDGLSEHVSKAVAPFYIKGHSPQAMTVRYADDFVITCTDKELLQKVIQPAVDEFLAVRGLWLNATKTVITHVRDGFDFLGFNFRTYPCSRHPSGLKLLVKPAAKKVVGIRRKLSCVFKEMRHATAYELIRKLNPVLRGWGGYFQHVTSKQVFADLDHYVWRLCWIWGTHKYRKVNAGKRMDILFRPSLKRKDVFFGRKGENEIQVFFLASIPIKRHTLVRDLNPFLIENAEYFLNRSARGGRALWSNSRWALLLKTKCVCKVCSQMIEPGQEMDVHHVVPVAKGGSNVKANLIALHRECHKQVTYTKNTLLKARFVELGITKES